MFVLRQPWDRLFEQVRKRTVAHVVKKCSRDRFASVERGDAMFDREHVLDRSQPIEEQRHHVGGTDGVSKARVLGPRKRERREPELANATQALNLPRVEQPRHQARFGRFERHEPMNRITENHAAHGSGPAHAMRARIHTTPRPRP